MEIIIHSRNDLFQKIKQIVEIVGQGLPSKKDFDAVMEENIDEMIEKGETVRSSMPQKGRSVAKATKSGVKSTTRAIKRSVDNMAGSARKSTKRK